MNIIYVLLSLLLSGIGSILAFMIYMWWGYGISEMFEGINIVSVIGYLMVVVVTIIISCCWTMLSVLPISKMSYKTDEQRQRMQKIMYFVDLGVMILPIVLSMLSSLLLSFV